MPNRLARFATAACAALQLVVIAGAAQLDGDNSDERQLLTTPRRRANDAAPRALILSGQNAAANAYPYFTFSQFGRGGGCGATLIHEDILLTAAHCAVVFEGRGAYVGGLADFGNDGEFHEDEVVLQHPDFDFDTFANDIMLIKLATSSTKTPVQLNREPAVPVEGDLLTVLGFGDTTEDGNLSPVLLMANVNVVPFQPCQALFLNESKVLLQSETQVCAEDTTGASMDACQGDSGGPLLNSQGQQVGIISFGLGCGKVSGVYTRVRGFIDWIDENVCRLSKNPPTSCSAPITPTPAPSASQKTPESPQMVTDAPPSSTMTSPKAEPSEGSSSEGSSMSGSAKLQVTAMIFASVAMVSFHF